jgi:hypothetical protein
MPSIPQRLAAAFALTFLAGGLTGYFAGNRTATVSSTTNRGPGSGESSSRLQPQRETSGELERGDLGSHSMAALGDADIPRRILAAVRVRDYFRRRFEIYAVGQLLDRETIRAAMDATQQFSETDCDTAQYALVARWLELDPAAAYEWVRALPGKNRREELTREFFHSLGLKDPTTALSFLAQYKVDRNQDEDFTYSVFEAWSAHDPSAAVDAALNLQQGDSQESALRVALERWARTNPQGALERVAQLPDDEMRRDSLRNVLREWAEEDPQAAANHALSLPDGKERNDALAAALSGSAAKDRDTTMRLIEQLPAGAVRTEAVRQVVGRIANSEPKLAAELVLGLPPAQQRNSVHEVSHYLARRDRAAALEWAGRLASADARRFAMHSVMQQWVSDDPKAAAEYCASHDVDGSQFIDNAVEGWARTDAAGALAWARGLPDGPQREVALAGGISALAASNPQQAASLATTLLNGDRQSEALGSIAGAWASNEPAAAAAWASELSDRSARANAVSSVASTWVRQDPAAAAAWAVRMPDNLNVLARVAQEWAVQDSAAAARWLNTVPSGDARDSAVTNFARAIVDSDPESAAAWAATISQQGQRDASISEVYSQWNRTDPKAAEAWLRATPALSEQARERMLRRND